MCDLIVSVSDHCLSLYFASNLPIYDICELKYCGDNLHNKEKIFSMNRVCHYNFNPHTFI